MSKFDLGSKSPHNATRLLRLVVTLNIQSECHDLVDHVASLLPMDRNDIATLFVCLWFVVMIEESFWFHSRCVVWFVYSPLSTIFFLLYFFLFCITFVVGAKCWRFLMFLSSIVKECFIVSVKICIRT
jgi:hypothetical protein